MNFHVFEKIGTVKKNIRLTMSQFEVKVRKVNIGSHPNADSLEIAQVFGYQSIVQKGQFQSGDLAIYIPESSVLPDALIEHLGLTGRLAGSNCNRVKAVKLRSHLSQGLTIKKDGLEKIFGPNQPSFEEGTDWQEYLKIVKYFPPIPMQMSGKIKPVYHKFWEGYTDIENIKRWPDVIQEGEPIVATEKLHGTNGLFSLLFDPEHNSYNWFVSSKGISTKMRCCIEEDEKNVYWRASKKFNLREKAELILSFFNKQIEEITFFGEVLGVQDLKYGLQNGEIGFRLFDIRINGEYLSVDQFLECAKKVNLETVPFLYRGISISECLQFTSGQTTIENATHIREGIVIKPETEKRIFDLGRIILKSVSPEYLLRKGNTTEFE